MQQDCKLPEEVRKQKSRGRRLAGGLRNMIQIPPPRAVLPRAIDGVAAQSPSSARSPELSLSRIFIWSTSCTSMKG